MLDDVVGDSRQPRCDLQKIAHEAQKEAGAVLSTLRRPNSLMRIGGVLTTDGTVFVGSARCATEQFVHGSFHALVISPFLVL